jgi:hypothetical protein
MDNPDTKTKHSINTEVNQNKRKRPIIVSETMCSGRIAMYYTVSGNWGRHGRNRMKFGFTTKCAISVYHHLSCGSEPRPFQGVLDTTLFDIVRQLLATGRCFSLGTPVSFSNKTERHDITHILLK